MSQAIAPKLTREEEIYVLSLTDLTERTLGEDAGKLVAGKNPRLMNYSASLICDRCRAVETFDLKSYFGICKWQCLLCALCVAIISSGDALLEPTAVARFLLSVLSTGRLFSQHCLN